MLPWQMFKPLPERELVGMDWGSEPSRAAATVVDMGRNMQGETVEFRGLDEQSSIWKRLDLEAWSGMDLSSARRQMLGESFPADDELAKEDPAPRRPAPPKPDPVRRSREVAIVVGDEADVVHSRRDL